MQKNVIAGNEKVLYREKNARSQNAIHHHSPVARPVKRTLCWLVLKAKVPVPVSVEDTLCVRCGLCCNGAIFADVKLQHGDNASRLCELGMPLTNRASSRSATRGQAQLAFSQSCAMFKRGLCTIYSERPKYCREFRCALLKRTSSGRVSVSRALQVIRRTRRRISVVEGLLEQLGDVDQRRTLTERLTRTTSRLTKIGLDPRLAALYSDLTLAFQGLIINIDAEFYPGSDSGIR